MRGDEVELFHADERALQGAVPDGGAGCGWIVQHERQVEVAVPYGRLRLLRYDLPGLDPYAGVPFGEGGQRGWHEGAREGRQYAHGEVGREGFPGLLERYPGALLGGQDLLGVLREHTPGLRQAHAAPDMLQQRHTHLTLQRRQLLGDGGGRVVERRRRFGEGAAAGQLPEHPETVQREFH